VLLEHGADPNTLDRDGRSALFWALFKKQRATTHLLVAHGAEVGTMSLDIFDY